MILHAVGLDDWGCTDIDGYVARAMAAASDLNALAEMRMALRPRFMASWHRRCTMPPVWHAPLRQPTARCGTNGAPGRKLDWQQHESGGSDMLSIAPSARVSPLADIETSGRGKPRLNATLSEAAGYGEIGFAPCCPRPAWRFRKSPHCLRTARP